MPIDNPDYPNKIFVGRVLGISESISFHGDTVATLTADFMQQSIIIWLTAPKWDDYRKNRPLVG